MKNAVLRVSALGNRIFLGTISKKDNRVLNEKKVDFTDQAIRAVVQHMIGVYEDSKGKHDCYEFDGGKLIWQPSKKES